MADLSPEIIAHLKQQTENPLFSGMTAEQKENLFNQLVELQKQIPEGKPPIPNIGLPPYWDDLFGAGTNSMTRLKTFVEISGKYEDKIYWQALAMCYENSDNLGVVSRQVLKGLFTVDRGCREYLMKGPQRRAYNKLPPIVTIYRGMTIEERESGDYGVSWTLSKKVAEYFAFVYPRNYEFGNHPKCVIRLDVPKEKIIAYWNTRKEKEVIYIH